MKDQLADIWNHYLSRQLKNDLEPNWIHYGYELIYKLLNDVEITEKEKHIANDIMKSFSLKDGFSVPSFPSRPQSPSRIIHDGWKAGTATWIFMGRSENPIKYLGDDWIAVERTLPDDLYKLLDSKLAPPTLVMAYNKNRQMGINNADSNAVGPAIYMDDLIKAIETLEKQ